MLVSECGVTAVWPGNITKKWTPAEVGTWPWTVLLHFSIFGMISDIPGCMGTLIDKEWVVTSALCTHLGPMPIQANSIKVAVGKHKRTAAHSAFELISVVKVVRHKDFKAETTNLQSNVALLKLARPVKFTDRVRPICLPSRQEVEGFLSVGRNREGVLIGWKKLNGHKYDTRLQQTSVKLVHRHHCKWAARRYDPHRMICAGFDHEEPCISDSGSPLVFPVTHPELAKKWVLGGVLSWGLNTFSKGCHPHYGYSAYVNLGRYLRFIRHHVKPKNRKKNRRGARKKRTHRKIRLEQRKLRQARRLAKRIARRN